MVLERLRETRIVAPPLVTGFQSHWSDFRLTLPSFTGSTLSLIHSTLLYTSIMSALVAGYESSDDESAPVASTSTRKLPSLGNAFEASAEADEEDDEKLEEQARVDAFGLTSQTAEENVSRSEVKAVVKAAPEVLKEVSTTPLLRRAHAEIRIPTEPDQLSSSDPPTRS